MQPDATGIAGIAHVIQLAVAPVFLLAGVGATLNVLASRLARIVDRARPMEERLLAADPQAAAPLRRHLKVLALRARLINRALTLSVLCALLVALVVVALFIGAAFDLDFSVLIAVLFMAGMLSLAAALLYFLREVFVATANLRIGAPP